MACPSAEEVAALFDCVLPADQAERLREHLVACPRCARDFRLIEELLRCGADERRPPAALLDRARILPDKAPTAAGSGEQVERPGAAARRPRPRSTTR